MGKWSLWPGSEDLAGDDGEQAQEHAGFQEEAQGGAGQPGPTAAESDQDVEQEQIEQEDQSQVGIPIEIDNPWN